MSTNPRDIKALRTVLLVALDGCEFPNAMNALREAGFSGRVWAVTHREWTPILQGGCDRILPFPPSDASKKSRALALLRILLTQGRKVDAIVWVSPPTGRLGKLFRSLAVRKPVFCFYGGRPAPYDAQKTPGPPVLDHGGAREREAALGYLTPLLAQGVSQKATLRIGVDGDGIHSREATGVQWARRHLFAALCDEDLGIDLRVTSPVSEARSVWETPWSSRMHRIPPPLAAYTPLHREAAIPVEAVTGSIDLFHQTFFDPPKFRFKNAVATVHDLTPLALPEEFPERFIARLKAIQPFWRDECARLICVSEATRDDLERLMGIPKSRTVCIPNGRHPHFSPRGEAEVNLVLRRYGIRKPYLMALGSIAPHKNLQGLCEAFSVAHSRFGTPHQLVIVGRPGWMMKDILEKIRRSGVADRVLFTGYADWCDLPALYSGAVAFCMPSLYEGYGLPVQEAMCCGCPVLLSDCTSLPEVAGDAGIYWDPRNPDNMADCMERIVSGALPRAEMTERVLTRAQTFPTWQEVALAHKRIYQETIENR